MSYKIVNHGFLIEGEVLFLDNEETISLSRDSIEGIKALENYAENVLPLFQISLLVSLKKRDMLRDRPFELSLSFYRYDANQNYTLDQDQDQTIVPENKIFSCVFKKYEQSCGSSTTKTDPDSQGDGDLTDVEKTARYILHSVPKDLVVVNEDILNVCFQDVTVPDVLVYLLTRYLPGKDLFIEEDILNDNKFPSIIFPPMNISQSITYLQNNYGIYDSGVNFFFSPIGTYIMSNNYDKIPTQNTLKINIVPRNDSNQEELTKKLMISDDGNITLTLVEQPQMLDLKNIQTDLIGTRRNYFSYDPNFLTKVNTQDDENTEFKKVRYFYNESGYSMAETEHEMRSRYSRGTVIPLNNIDPSLITPFTKVQITGGTPISDGDYLIMSKQYSFTSGDYTHFSPTVLITLAKYER